MNRNHTTSLVAALTTVLSFACPAPATETENLDFRILPVPGSMVIDGKANDWDLSGSMFICSDVENYRDQFASWQSAMFDADNLYLLTRWVDTTPMNNPGICGSDQDGKDYVQEIAIPWKMITRDGALPKAGGTIIMTYEPNFGTSSKMRITTKDLFRTGVTPDRVFAFMTSPCWGLAKLEASGRTAPSAVRLSDERSFARPTKPQEAWLFPKQWRVLTLELKKATFSLARPVCAVEALIPGDCCPKNS